MYLNTHLLLYSLGLIIIGVCCTILQYIKEHDHATNGDHQEGTKDYKSAGVD